jgi:hypothetical protein
MRITEAEIFMMGKVEMVDITIESIPVEFLVQKRTNFPF